MRLLIVFIVLTMVFSSCTRMTKTNGKIVTDKNVNIENIDSTIWRQASEEALYNQNIIFSKDGKTAYVWTLDEQCHQVLQYEIRSEEEEEVPAWGIFFMGCIVLVLLAKL